MKLPKGMSLIEKGDIKLSKLYNTLIYDESEYFIDLNTDGWFTKHTKKCLNIALGNKGKVYQKDKKWYVCINNMTKEFDSCKITYDKAFNRFL